MKVTPRIEPVYGKIFKIGNRVEHEVSGACLEPFFELIPRQQELFELSLPHFTERNFERLNYQSKEAAFELTYDTVNLDAIYYKFIYEREVQTDHFEKQPEFNPVEPTRSVRANTKMKASEKLTEYFDQLAYAGSQRYKNDVFQRAGRIMQPEEFVVQEDPMQELEGGKQSDNLYERSNSDNELDRESLAPSVIVKSQEDLFSPNKHSEKHPKQSQQEPIRIENGNDEPPSLMSVLVQQVRQYEDMIYFKKYSSEQEKHQINAILSSLRKQRDEFLQASEKQSGR